MSSELLDQIKKSFEFDLWANGRYVKALSDMPQPPAKAVSLLAHILFAKDVWLTRLLKEDLSRFKGPWPELDLEGCRKGLSEVQGKWGRYLGSLDPAGLTADLIYPNTQGKMFKNKVLNILIHVVNHSTYHRGQIAPLVTQGGGVRPETDYIAYAMEIGEGGKA